MGTLSRATGAIFRFFAESGQPLDPDPSFFAGDPNTGTDSLLVPVMKNGRRMAGATSGAAAAVRAAQERFLAGRRRLPGRMNALGVAEPPYPVSYSRRLEELCEQLRQSFVSAANI